MSFYDVPGDGPKSLPVSDYTDSVIEITRGMKPKVSEMIQQLAMGTRVDLAVIRAAAKYANTDTGDSEYKVVRRASYGDDYKSTLVPGFVINDIANAIPFFKELDSQGSLKIEDIKSLKYSIMAFNTRPENWTSIKKSLTRFNLCNDDLYHITLTYNKKPFGMIISSYQTKVGKCSYSSDRNSSLKETWFPKIDAYFHSEENRSVDRVVIVQDFVELCRNAVKGREVLNEL